MKYIGGNKSILARDLSLLWLWYC